jgi:hypothetical protein
MELVNTAGPLTTGMPPNVNWLLLCCQLPFWQLPPSLTKESWSKDLSDDKFWLEKNVKNLESLHHRT